MINLSKTKEFWSAFSSDIEFLQLLRLDREKLEDWIRSTDGCASLEDWDDESGFCIGLKGTEGVRMFASLITSKLEPFVPPSRAIVTGEDSRVIGYQGSCGETR